MTRRTLEFLVPERLRITKGQRLVSALLVRFAFLGFFGSLLYGTIYFFADAIVLGVSAVFFGIFFLFLLLSFRWVKSNIIILRGFMIGLYFAYLSQMLLTGGADSPVIPQLVFVPLLALIYGVGKDWYFFLTLVLLTITTIFILDLMECTFMNELSGIHFTLFTFVNHSFPYIAFASFLPPFLKKLISDKQALKEAYHELTDKNRRLAESEKLASLGQLTAGIAHEINNPINYTLGGASRLKENVKDLITYEQGQAAFRKAIVDGLNDGSIKDEKDLLRSELKQLKELELGIQYDALIEEMDELINSVELGAARTAEIVKGLRTFSRLDNSEFKEVDIIDSIHSSLVILSSEYKDHIRIEKDYEPLPNVECNPGRINQVFLNVISNAIHSIKEEGFLKITTRHDVQQNKVRIRIEDNGSGIPKAIESQIFNPFFTTKEVGKGTGLGLSVCKGIVDEHHGNLHFKSLEGVGTTFFVELPITQPNQD